MKKCKYVLVAIILIFQAVALCGCNATSLPNPINLAIVYGMHANAPTPTIMSSEVQSAIIESVRSYGRVCIILADGSPFVVADYDIEAPTINLSASKRDSVAELQCNEITTRMNEASALVPEVDTLEAISLAARSLQTSTGERRLLILDSGVSTTGYVNYTLNLLRGDSNALVDYLGENSAIPDLTGTSVTWIGLGDVTGEQEALTPTNKQTLEDHWRSILTAAGADDISFKPDLPGATTDNGVELPPVTPVSIIQDNPFVITADAEASLSQPVFLDESKIFFLPGSAEFADPDAANEALAPIADCLIASPETKIILAGTTATVGSNESCIEFSMTRAEAVAQALVSLGVSEDQIAAIKGLGYDHEYHLPDLSPDGTLNENAPTNRSVLVVSAESEVGRSIVDNY